MTLPVVARTTASLNVLISFCLSSCMSTTMTLVVVAPTITSLNLLVRCLSFQPHEHYDDLGGGGTDDNIAQFVNVMLVLPAASTR